MRRSRGSDAPKDNPDARRSLRASEKVREFLAKGDHKGIAVFEPQIMHKALAVEDDP